MKRQNTITFLAFFMICFISCKSQTLKKNDLSQLGLNGPVKILITSTSEEVNINMPYDSINFNKDGFITQKYTISENCCDSRGNSENFISESATYQYDSKQNLNKIVTVNEYLHNIVRIDSMEYDSNNKLISIKTIKHLNSADEITKDTLIYSNTGLLIEKRTVSNSRDSDYFVFKYNEKEKLIEKSWFMGKNNLFAKDNYFYNEIGNMEKRINDNGIKLTELYKYKFDSQKNWVQKIVNNGDILKRKIYYY